MVFEVNLLMYRLKKTLFKRVYTLQWATEYKNTLEVVKVHVDTAVLKCYIHLQHLL